MGHCVVSCPSVSLGWRRWQVDVTDLRQMIELLVKMTYTSYLLQRLTHARLTARRHLGMTKFACIVEIMKLLMSILIFA